jgi:transcriptional antiterminator
VKAIEKCLNFMKKKGFIIKLFIIIESAYTREKLNIDIDTSGGESLGIIERK